MKTIYIDNFSYDEHHMKFNASFLLSVIKTGSDVVYKSASSSRNNVLKYIPNEYCKNIKFKDSKVFKGEFGIKLQIRRLFQAIMDTVDLINNKDSIHIYNSNSFILFPLFNFLNKFLKRKVLICCHSELEAFAKPHSERRMLSKFLCNMLYNTKISQNIYFAVLSDHIFKNLKEILPSETISHFVSFDHPFIFESHKENNPVCTTKSPLIFASISNLNTERGLGLLHVVKHLREDNSDAKIKTIGRVLDSSVASNLSINGVEVSGYLARIDYDNQINEINYALFLYPKNSYRFTASGAYFDALDKNKPVIALGNQYLEYVDSKYGLPGLICKDESDMASKINQLNEGQINSLEYNFLNLKNQFSPDAISVKLKEILKRL